MTSPIIDMAQKLGQAVAESTQARALSAARKELNEHKDVLDTLQAYQKQAGHMQELEQQNKAIEVDDKRKFQELHDKLVASDVFKKYTVAEMEFVDLMRQVNTTIRKQISDSDKPAK